MNRIMKTLNNKSKMIIIAALVVIAALCADLRVEQRTQAQNVSPSIGNRISFGLVGITAGQTMRISVVNTLMPNDANLPPDPCRVVLNFRNSSGQLVRNRNGEVIRKVVDLERGESTFLDLNFDGIPPPISDRLQLRAVVVVLPPPVPDRNQLPPDPCIVTVEVINNVNGRTAFAIAALPAVQQLQSLPVGD
jgi:hypothetical protein